MKKIILIIFFSYLYLVPAAYAQQSFMNEYYEDGKLKVEWIKRGDEDVFYKKELYPTGRIKTLGIYKKGRLNGFLREYYPEGALKTEAYYVDGKVEGDLKEFYPSGVVKSEVPFQNGSMEGAAKDYDQKGNLENESTYKKGRLEGDYKEFNQKGEVTFQTKLQEAPSVQKPPPIQKTSPVPPIETKKVEPVEEEILPKNPIIPKPEIFVLPPSDDSLKEMDETWARAVGVVSFLVILSILLVIRLVIRLAWKPKKNKQNKPIRTNRIEEELRKSQQLLDELAALEELNILGWTSRRAYLSQYKTLSENLEWQVKRSQAAEAALAVLNIDIDGFTKLKNDLGVEASDEAVKKIQQIIKANLREKDTVYRVDEDEFLIVLPDTTQEMLKYAGEKLVRSIESYSFDQKVTISVGGCVFRTGMRKRDLIKQASRALAEAKINGKNRCALI